MPPGRVAARSADGHGRGPGREGQHRGALGGDQRAAARLRASVYGPLAAAPSPLLATIEAYLAAGGALEPTARNLFVHPNTVRYRLHRIADLTGRDPWDPRDLMVLRTAVILGRLAQTP